MEKTFQLLFLTFAWLHRDVFFPKLGHAKQLQLVLEHDPQQEQPLSNPAIEQQMVDHLINLMKACDAPPEQYERLGLRA